MTGNTSRRKGEWVALPWPPSVNRLFTNRRGGRAKTPAYQAWIKEAGLELLTQQPNRHEGEVAVHIIASPPDRRKRDLDNLFKPVLDLLVRHNVIADDSIQYLRMLSIELGAGEPQPGLDVRVRALKESAP